VPLEGNPDHLPGLDPEASSPLKKKEKGRGEESEGGRGRAYIYLSKGGTVILPAEKKAERLECSGQVDLLQQTKELGVGGPRAE